MSTTIDPSSPTSHWIGKGNTFADAPADIQAVFSEVIKLPAFVETYVLPSKNASVLSFIAHTLPPIANQNTYPRPSSYFRKDSPPLTLTDAVDFLQTLPVPPRHIVDKLRFIAGQMWSDGYESLVYLHTDNKRLFPFWIIQYWSTILEIQPTYQIWTTAEVFLATRQKKLTGDSRRVADEFRTLLHSLPWHGEVQGFSMSGDTSILAAFISTKWLSETHESFMLETIQRRARSSPETSGDFLAPIYTSTDIRAAYDNRDTNPYPPKNRTTLSQIGYDLGRGDRVKPSMLWHLNRNHWVTTSSPDPSKILFADPKGQPLPASIKDPLEWWLKIHFPDVKSRAWGELPCSRQPTNDNHSCGILSINAAAHQHLPNEYPLADPTQLTDERMKLGMEVIRHHIKMLPTTSTLLPQTSFTFRSPTKRSTPTTPTKSTTDDLVDQLSAMKVSPMQAQIDVRMEDPPSPTPPTRRRITYTQRSLYVDDSSETSESESLPILVAGSLAKTAKAKPTKAAGQPSLADNIFDTIMATKGRAKEGKTKKKNEVTKKVEGLKDSRKRKRDLDNDGHNTEPESSEDEDEPNYSGRLEDCPAKKKKQHLGRPVLGLLDQISRRCRDRSDHSVVRYRCLGDGCKRSWAKPRNKKRVLKHACHCQRLPPDLRKEANAIQTDESLSARLERLDKQVKEGAQTDPTRADPKRSKTDDPTTDKDSPSFLDIYVGDTGRKLLQAKIDIAIINLICAAAIAPTIVDYHEWKKIFELANNKYHPWSSTTLVDDHIPGQAAHARQLTLKYLATEYHLTISYDGMTTRKPQSAYTIHFTTPDGRSFLIDGQEASDESHTGEHIAKQLLRTMDLIGREHFSGITGDSTGNTKLARQIVCDEVKTLINMPDVCHHTSLACKDICRLPMFAEVIGILRVAISFFSKSTHAMTLLTEQRKVDQISRGLEKIGKTRFATICISAISLERCKPSIVKLVSQGFVKITNKDVNQVFIKDSHRGAIFWAKLKQMIKILTPFAKAIACLESSQSCPADVYIFWLAIMSELKRLFEDENTGISDSEAASIRAIANSRFKALIDEGYDDCYIAAFYLDPRYVQSNVLRKINPLASSDSVPATKRKGPSPTSGQTHPSPVIQRRVRKYLQMLVEIEWKSRANPVLRSMPAKSVVNSFTHQFECYSQLRYPFDKPLADGQSVRGWWKALLQNPDASVLATIGDKLASVKPNSMPEERTVSVFTRMNTTTRNAQEVRTLVDMTQIRQYNMYRAQESLNYERPTVKFCDIDQAIFGNSRITKLGEHKVPTTTPSLSVDDNDVGEEIGNDGSREWMDDIEDVDGEDDFGPVEADMNLDAPELHEILLDVVRDPKGKGKVVKSPVSDAESDGSSDNDDDDDNEWDWS